MNRVIPHPMRLRALLLIAVLLGGLASAAPSQNDAGSGGDAGNTRAQALALSAYGAYTGELKNSDDTSDWYTITDAPSGPACIEMRESSEKIRGTRLTIVEGAMEKTVTAEHGDNGMSVLAIAASEVNASYLNINSGYGSGVNARSGPYSFSLNAYRTVSTPDAGTGIDAGNNRANAIPIAAGCHGGRLGYGQIALDTIDYYRIDLQAGDRIVASLGADLGAPLMMLIEDTQGNALTTTVGPDGMLAYTSATNQPVYLKTSSSSLSPAQFPYLVGIVVGPPGEPGCNPTC